jgi:GntR family transcriptional regulator, transcriptional repressor for pyruvate dehydrogenase complex
MMFKPIKPKLISDQVFEQLRDLIYRGYLKPGDRMMTERELAQELGVSRPTVRDALHKLVAMDLVEHRQGQGTFVSSPAAKKDKNPLAAVMESQNATLEDLLEVRLGLETQAAALAAQRATTEDIQELDKCLQEMVAEITEGRLGIDADVSFHMAIAFATKNSVHVNMMRSFYDLLFFGIKENLHQLYENAENLKKVIEQHHAIVDGIRRHDPEAAYTGMKRHINFVLDYMRARRASDAAVPAKGR